MINQYKQWILEGISKTKKMEEMVAKRNGPGSSSYSQNRKAQGEGSTAADFFFFIIHMCIQGLGHFSPCPHSFTVLSSRNLKSSCCQG
jgi:hypothetical protein